MSSISGIQASEGYLAYGSSKAALIEATRIMANDFASVGIRVNAIAPGFVDTDIHGWKSDELTRDTIEASLLKRKASPKEIAQMITFLSSSHASFATGQTFIVDGGALAIL